MPCHYPQRRSPAITWKDPSFKGTELSFFVYLHVWVGSNLWNSNYMQKMMNDSLWWDYNWFTGISLASVMRAHYSKALLRLNVVVEKAGFHYLTWVYLWSASLVFTWNWSCTCMFLNISCSGNSYVMFVCNKASISGQVGWQPKVMFTASGLYCWNSCLGDALLINLRWVWSRIW